jgi:hypothetical protein
LMPDKVDVNKAFVIGPIGDRDAAPGSSARTTYEEAIQVLEEVILPACEAFGIEATRADRIARTGEIPEQAFRLLRDSPLVIADLTGANGNVMYELGLRHTTGKLTIQIGERDRLPFDIVVIRTILFKRTEGGLVEARRKLAQALATALESGGDPVTATRVWFEITPPAALAEDSPPGEPDDETGFLEKLADTESGMDSLGRAMSTTSNIMGEITAFFADSTARVQDLDKTGGTSAAKLALANRLASLLEEPASRLEVSAGEYGQSVQRMEPGIKYLLTRLANEPGQLAAAPEFPRQMAQLTDAAGGTVPITLGFKTQLEQIGAATRSLRRVTRRIATTLQSFADSSSRVASWKPLVDRLPKPPAD